ncbi:MAG: MFS transporter [Thermomicrobiales bacterium]
MPNTGQSQPSRKPPRTRPRPVVAPQRRRPEPIDHNPLPVQTESPDLIPTLDIDVYPIGGIFSTAEAPALSESETGRIPRVSKALRSRGRSAPAKPAEPSLFLDQGFKLLWTTRLMTQIAQGALLYSLLILVVDLSNRSVYNSLFVMCASIPSLIFGLPAGIVVDTIPHKFLLVLLNSFRFLFMVFMVAAEPSIPGVFAATLGIWVIHQFYSPAEATMLASIVPPRRYTEAQALFNLALTLSQAIGLVILAPILLKVGGARSVFALAGILYILAIAMTVLLPRASELVRPIRKARQSLRRSLGDGLRFALRDRLTFEAIIDDVLVSVGMSALIVIMPFYLERVLGTSKENTVFVFAPAALGLILGLRIAPKLGTIIGERYSATLSLFLFSACVAALGFIEPTFTFLDTTLRLPLQQAADMLSISPLVAMAMIISIPAGLASAVVNVAARSILLSRTPAQMRGQVIATQGLVGNVISLVPTLIAGLAMDIFGVKPIAVAIAIGVVLIAVIAHEYGRRQIMTFSPAPQT